MINENELQLTPEQQEQELKLTKDCISRNPKSYPSWHQRKWLLERIPNPNFLKEMSLCASFLQQDERNFHCWNFRQFIVRKLNVAPEEESQFLDKKLDQNFSNYSAWHYRSKLLPALVPDGNPEAKLAILTSELEKVEQIVFTEPDDQSVWWYYQFLISWAEDLTGIHYNFDYLELLQVQVDKIGQLAEIEVRCKWALVTLGFLHGRIRNKNLDKSSEMVLALNQRCSEIYARLIQIDPTHKAFYEAKLKGLHC